MCNRWCLSESLEGIQAVQRQPVEKISARIRATANGCSTFSVASCSSIQLPLFVSHTVKSTSPKQKSKQCSSPGKKRPSKKNLLLF